jgi:IS605 OrfB family transposase
MRKAFKYRLYPTKKQQQVLLWTLARCRELYNAALSEWKDAYQQYERTQLQSNPETGQVIAATMVTHKRVLTVSYYQQKRDLPEIKDIREEYQDIHSQVLQDALLRLKRAFDGTFIESPRYYRRAQKKLERLQKALSKKKRGSHRRGKAVKQLARVQRKIANQRRDFHHKQAKKLVHAHQTIVFEELKIANTSHRARPKQDEHGTYLPNGASAKSGLNKSILDAGWGQFQQIVSHKAACAGRTVLKVSPRNTSQVCSQCGIVRKKSLEERWHSCECGCELDRDTNAAINILRLGRSQRGDTPRVEAPCQKTRESSPDYYSQEETPDFS